jgi:hypothetical protein
MTQTKVTLENHYGKIFIEELSKQGPTVIVTVSFLVIMYLVGKMVVEGMKGYTRTQESLIKQLASFSSTIEKQTETLSKQTK